MSVQNAFASLICALVLTFSAMLPAAFGGPVLHDGCDGDDEACVLDTCDDQDDELALFRDEADGDDEYVAADDDAGDDEAAAYLAADEDGDDEKATADDEADDDEAGRLADNCGEGCDGDDESTERDGACDDGACDGSDSDGSDDEPAIV